MPTLKLKDTHSSQEFQSLLKNNKDELMKTRIKILLLIKKGLLRKEISERLSVHVDTITDVVRRYNKNGLESLKTNKGGHPKGNPKWEHSIFEALCKEIDKGGYWSIPRMQEWITKNHEKEIPEQTVWYRMDQLNYSYKSSRPHPVQGDRERQESFKKGGSFRSWSR